MRTNVCLTGAQERPRPFRVAAVTLCAVRVAIVAGILALLMSRYADAQEKRTPESDLALTGLGSFGHFHIFANSWWSYLDIAGVEYDRNSWGRAAGARMDYSAEVQPMVLLWQPSKQTVWGTPASKQHEFVYGIGLMPIGLRMLWRDGKRFEPYLMSKGGVLLFDKKALSSQASYGDFSLQMGTGAQFRLSRRVDGRVGFSYFHFSNAFMTPSNPGLDSMTYSTGLVYHLGAER